MLLLSEEGRPIARRGAIKEAPVEIARLDPLTPAAFIAIEDRRFRSHWGIDPRAIGRAMVANFSAGGVRQGGSTLTQQLAKTSFLSSDRSYKRKAQEVIIAFWLEAWLTKDEILSRYLSSVYFGDGVYGLRAASNHYFDRAPGEFDAGPVGDAGGDGPGAVAARPDAQPGRRAEAQPAGAPGDGRYRRDQPVARAARRRSARPVVQPAQDSRPAPISPTGSRPQRTRRVRGQLWRGQGDDDARRRPPAAGGARDLQCRGRRGAGGAGGDAPRRPRRRDGRRQELQGIARSTAPPRRAASRDRRSNCSSISPRCAPATRPTT